MVGIATTAWRSPRAAGEPGERIGHAAGTRIGRAGLSAMIALSAANRTRRLGLLSASASGEGLPSAVNRMLSIAAFGERFDNRQGGVRVVVS